MRNRRQTAVPPAGLLGSVCDRYRQPGAWRRRALQPPDQPAAETETPAVVFSASKQSRVEAVLWLADEPLTDRRIARLAGLDSVAEARGLIGDLRRRYASRGGALEVAAVAGGRRLMSRPEYEPWLAKTCGNRGESSPRVSGPMLETLAIVAYRQPVLRSEVEAIRGVGCGELLRQLLDADLLRIVGRSSELGRPLLYGTTARFLELFGLGELDDLPRLAASVEQAQPTKNNASPEPSRVA